MLDKRGKLFGKLNIIDCLLIVLLIGLVLAGVYRFTAGGMTRDTDGRVRYTLMIEGVREFTLQYYKIGLRAFDQRQQEFIGEIVAVRYEPLSIPLNLDDGTIVMAERPGVIRIFIDIEADARETDTAILIGGAYELKVGSRIFLNTKFIDVEAVVSAAEMIQ